MDDILNTVLFIYNILNPTEGFLMEVSNSRLQTLCCMMLDFELIYFIFLNSFFFFFFPHRRYETPDGKLKESQSQQGQVQIMFLSDSPPADFISCR